MLGIIKTQVIPVRRAKLGITVQVERGRNQHLLRDVTAVRMLNTLMQSTMVRVQHLMRVRYDARRTIMVMAQLVPHVAAYHLQIPVHVHVQQQLPVVHRVMPTVHTHVLAIIPHRLRVVLRPAHVLEVRAVVLTVLALVVL